MGGNPTQMQPQVRGSLFFYISRLNRNRRTGYATKRYETIGFGSASLLGTIGLVETRRLLFYCETTRDMGTGLIGELENVDHILELIPILESVSYSEKPRSSY